MTSADDILPFAFVTIATGKRFYLEMAVDMVLTLRRFHDEPVVLLAEGDCLDEARASYADLFTRIVAVPEVPAKKRRAKFLLADLTPAHRAIFVDADILVLKPLQKLIDVAGREPVAMMGSFVGADTTKRHHGIPIPKLCSAFGTDRFFTSHSAAILFDRDRARPFMTEAAKVHEEMLILKPGPFIGDELAFGIAGARCGVAQMPKPFPVIWSNEVDDLDLTTPPKPFLHFHLNPPRRVLEAALATVSELRRAHGFDPVASQAAWRRKARANAADPVAIVRKLRRQWKKLKNRVTRNAA